MLENLLNSIETDTVLLGKGQLHRSLKTTQSNCLCLFIRQFCMTRHNNKIGWNRHMFPDFSPNDVADGLESNVKFNAQSRHCRQALSILRTKLQNLLRHQFRVGMPLPHTGTDILSNGSASLTARQSRQQFNGLSFRDRKLARQCGGSHHRTGRIAFSHCTNFRIGQFGKVVVFSVIQGSRAWPSEVYDFKNRCHLSASTSPSKDFVLCIVGSRAFSQMFRPDALRLIAGMENIKRSVSVSQVISDSVGCESSCGSAVRRIKSHAKVAIAIRRSQGTFPKPTAVSLPDFGPKSLFSFGVQRWDSSRGGDAHVQVRA